MSFYFIFIFTFQLACYSLEINICDLRYVAQTLVLIHGKARIGPLRHLEIKVCRFMWPMAQDSPKNPPPSSSRILFSFATKRWLLWYNVITHIPKHQASWANCLQVCVWALSLSILQKRWIIMIRCLTCRTYLSTSSIFLYYSLCIWCIW